MAKIAVLGAGSWGIGLTTVLTSGGHEVTIWSALEREVNMLRKDREHENLKGVRIADDVIITDDLESAAADKDVLVMAVASPYTRETSKRLAAYVKDGQIIVSVAKGIEEGTLMTLSQIISQEIPQAEVAVLCGPSHAEEVGLGVPTSVVVGARTKALAEYLQDIFMTDLFRVYTNPDVIGMELGGALKNVIALAAGISDGLGYGDNTKAALITRGIHEISRLGLAMGAHIETLSGLTGLGDLIVTCASMHSRNRRAGILIGQGKSPQEAMDEVKQIVEGVYSAKAAKALADKYHIEMPLVNEVNDILFNGMDPRKATGELMGRCRKEETGRLAWPRD